MARTLTRAGRFILRAEIVARPIAVKPSISVAVPLKVIAPKLLLGMKKSDRGIRAYLKFGGEK